jgi:STE24 endopeptidase
MLVLSIVLAKLFPLVILPLSYPAKPLDRPTLTERLTSMARAAGMTITGVYDLGLSKDTKKANAMLAGLGSTRRVYLSDTLVGAFDDDQIAVVFAHELGHHIRKHIFKMIAMSAVVTSILVALIWWRLNPFAGQPGAWVGAVVAFAQVMLIATVYPLAIGPLVNAISRHFERQADRLALDLTRNPAAYRSAFDLLTRMNLADPDPPRWEEIMFDDHPAMAKRIAAADEWERLKGSGG